MKELGPTAGRALSHLPLGPPSLRSKLGYPAGVATETEPRGIDRLLELQEIDLSIDRLRVRRDELESGEDVRAARALFERAENARGELKLALDSLDREQRRLESEIDSLSRKADAEQH